MNWNFRRAILEMLPVAHKSAGDTSNVTYQSFVVEINSANIWVEMNLKDYIGNEPSFN